MKSYLVNKNDDNLTFAVNCKENELDKKLHTIALDGVEFDCELKLVDKRFISDKQRNFIWAMIGEIAKQNHGVANYYKDFEYERLKRQFMGASELSEFSTSNCSMTLANRFINYIIGYMLINDYNVHKWIVDTEHKFTQEHLYIMLLNGQCFITGRKDNIHLHHYDRLGFGADRTDWKFHVGKRIMLLHAVEHQLEHSQYDYMLNKNYIDVHDLPVVDERMAKAIANGTFYKMINKMYKNVEGN